MASDDHSGWAKIHRSILDDPLWTKKPFTPGQAWVDLILRANHKPGVFVVNGIPISLARGQLAVSQLTLATIWKWSRGRVRRFLADLKTVQRTVQRTDHLTTVITICNYDKYQGQPNQNGTTDGTTHGPQTRSKEVKNIKKRSRSLVRPGQPEFEVFYQAYPKKQKRAKAMQIWQSKIDPGLYQVIIDHVIERAKSDQEWLESGGRYVPQPSTFLNNQGWTDQYQTGEEYGTTGATRLTPSQIYDAIAAGGDREPNLDLEPVVRQPLPEGH